MAIDFGNGPQIKSRAIQGAKVDVQIGDTSAYGSLANNPLEGLTIPSEKDEVLNQIDNGENKFYSQSNSIRHNNQRKYFY